MPIRARLDQPISLLDSFGSPFAGKQSFLASLAVGQNLELRGSLQADGTLEVSAAEMLGNVAEVEAIVVSVDLAGRNLQWLQRGVEYVSGMPWPPGSGSRLHEAPMAPGFTVHDTSTGTTLDAPALQPGMTAELVLESAGNGWPAVAAPLGRFEQQLSGQIARVDRRGDLVIAPLPEDHGV